MECGGCNLAKHRDGKIVSTILAIPERSGAAARRRNNRCESWEFRRVLITRRRTGPGPGLLQIKSHPCLSKCRHAENHLFIYSPPPLLLPRREIEIFSRSEIGKDLYLKTATIPSEIRQRFNAREEARKGPNEADTLL